MKNKIKLIVFFIVFLCTVCCCNILVDTYQNKTSFQKDERPTVNFVFKNMTDSIYVSIDKCVLYGVKENNKYSTLVLFENKIFVPGDLFIIDKKIESQKFIPWNSSDIFDIENKTYIKISGDVKVKNGKYFYNLTKNDIYIPVLGIVYPYKSNVFQITLDYNSQWYEYNDGRLVKLLKRNEINYNI